MDSDSDTIVVRPRGTPADQLLIEAAKKKPQHDGRSNSGSTSSYMTAPQKISSEAAKLLNEDRMDTTASIFGTSSVNGSPNRAANSSSFADDDEFDTPMEDVPPPEEKKYIFAKQLPSQMIQLGSHFAVGERSILQLEKGTRFSIPGRANVEFNAVASYQISTTFVTKSFYESYILNQKIPWIGNTVLSYGYDSLVPIAPGARIHAGDPRQAAEALSYRGVVPIPICFGNGLAPTLVPALVVDDIFPLSVIGRRYHMVLGWDFFYNSAFPYQVVMGSAGLELELPPTAPSVRIENETITLNSSFVFRYAPSKEPIAFSSVVFDENSCLNTALPVHSSLAALARIMLELENAGNAASTFKKGADKPNIEPCKITKRTGELMTVLLPVLHALRLKSSNGYLFKTVKILCETPYCATVPQKLSEYASSNWDEKTLGKLVGKDILQGLHRILQEANIKLEVVVVTKEDNQLARNMLSKIRNIKKPEMIRKDYGPPRRGTDMLKPQVSMEPAREGGHVVEVFNANCGYMRAPGTMGFVST